MREAPTRDCEGLARARPFAFVEYTNEQDMRNAFQRADGRQIEGRAIVVDVMRSGTVKDWLPRKLGGGIGASRAGNRGMNINMPGEFHSKFDLRSTSLHY